MKKIIAFILIFSIFICGVAFYKPHKQYTKSFIVVNIDYKSDIVTLKDFNNFLFCFSGCEDWMVGDICVAILDDNGTEEIIFDDLIINVNYCGWVY